MKNHCKSPLAALLPVALMSMNLIGIQTVQAEYRGYWADNVQHYPVNIEPNNAMQSFQQGNHQAYYGKASYYAQDYNGHLTASQEVYDMYAMTAAHPDLAFGTLVRVTNLQNGHAVIVKINDRGPFKPERIIDVSWAAALQLDLFLNGSADVQLDVL